MTNILTVQFLTHFTMLQRSLPSLSSVERLFGQGGLIFTPKRLKLTYKNFEILLFLKVIHKVFKNGDLLTYLTQICNE